MIYLKNSGDTEVILTLYGEVNNVYPTFQFELVNTDLNARYIFSYPDHSSNPNYYNSFTFSVTNDLSNYDPDVINYDGEILPLRIGTYDYTVFEIDDEMLRLGKVDEGILIVLDENETPAIEDTDITPTYKNI